MAPDLPRLVARGSPRVMAFRQLLARIRYTRACRYARRNRLSARKTIFMRVGLCEMKGTRRNLGYSRALRTAGRTRR
jgi:hypothetical protein